MNKLSIIIPYYNSAESIGKLLDSILAETIDCQIIVVDDNSTKEMDKYELIKAKYGNRVDFCVNDSGVKGAGAARNVGLKRANGSYIMFADADDYFIAGWMKIVDEYIGSDSDMVVFNPTSWNEADNRKGYCTKQFSKEVMAMANKETDGEIRVRYLFTPVWSKLIKRELISDNDISFQETMVSNDVMFSMKAGHCCKRIIADERSIYCVVEREGTLTKRNSEESFRVRFDVFYNRINYLRNVLTEADFDTVVKNVDIFWFIKMIYENGYSNAIRKEFYGFCKKNRIPVNTYLNNYRRIRFKKKFANFIHGVRRTSENQ